MKEGAARLIRWLVALTIAGSALGCKPLPDMPPGRPIPAPRAAGIDAHALALAAIDCVMAPVVYDTPAWAHDDDEVASLGPDGASCATAARATRVGPARLYRVDSDALLDVRHAIGEGRDDARDPRETLTLFDKSVAAVMEARRARTALEREGATPGPESIEKIRATAMLAKLDDFGAKTEGSTGLEARAIARLVAANGFLQLARTEPRVRPYVAESLAAMVTRPRPSKGTSIGGGPPEETRQHLRAVSDAAAADLGALANQIPEGRLRAALERTVVRLAKFDADSAANGL